MLNTKEAIEKRRSIRKYRPDLIPDENIRELLDSARLAPSGCNAQPWRFKIVKETAMKSRLAEAAYNQGFIANAPVVIVCCADIQGYIDGCVSGSQDLGKVGALKDGMVTVLQRRADNLKTMDRSELVSIVAVNVTIAIEHIVLRALDFGLGSCWIRLFHEQKVKDLFGWPDNIYVVALLPIGYPAEAPKARKRLALTEILID